MVTEQKNSGVRKFFIFVVIIIALIAVGIIGWNLYKYKFIQGKVRSTVFEKTNGLYIIRYDNMELDEVAGYLHVTNLQVVPDTARFRQMVISKKNPPLLLALTVPELRITGVKTPKAMLDKKVNGKRLEINNASVVFYYAKGHTDTSNNAINKEIYQQLLGNLKEIQADTVEINNVALSFTDINTNAKTIEASNISIHLHDILIDSLHSTDQTRFFFAKYIQVTGDKGIVKNKTGLYFYYFEQFSFSNQGGLFSIKSLRIEPQLGEERFAAHAVLQHDRYNMAFRNVSLRHINLPRLMESDIIADSLVIKECIIKVYRDLSYKRDKVIRVGTYPQQLLMDLPVTISLKKMIIADAFIEYKEKNPKSDYSGRVQFTHANAVIQNITNEYTGIKADNHCILNFNARFLDMAPVHARIDLILRDPRGRFKFSGSIEPFNAQNLNVITEPMGLARIEKGKVNGLKFNFTGHNYGSDGKLTLLYEDLKISVLKKDSAENTLMKMKLASFVANIIAKNSNPSGKKPVRVAEVHYKRNTNRSFFNLMWKSVFVGVKESAGLGSKDKAGHEP